MQHKVVENLLKKFKEHNIYPSTNTEYVYAIIAMCLELKRLGSDGDSCHDIIMDKRKMKR